MVPGTTKSDRGLAEIKFVYSDLEYNREEKKFSSLDFKIKEYKVTFEEVKAANK